MRACGAVAPYTEILGGKLVTALVTSKETRSLYRRRYGNQVSEIASQLAGRPITRSAELAILTTTSLYGVSSSQYNRLVLRPEHCSSLTHEIRWEDLGLSAGFGTAHMSLSTSESLLEVAIERWHRSMKNKILLNKYYFPSELQEQLQRFVNYYNHERYHESLDNLTPADVYYGRGQEILEQRENIKLNTLAMRRQLHYDRQSKLVTQMS